MSPIASTDLLPEVVIGWLAGHVEPGTPVLWLPGRPPTVNVLWSSHWHKRASTVADWRATAAVLVRQARWPKMERVSVTAHGDPADPSDRGRPVNPAHPGAVH